MVQSATICDASTSDGTGSATNLRSGSLPGSPYEGWNGWEGVNSNQKSPCLTNKNNTGSSSQATQNAEVMFNHV